jgi:hypothetical protein
MSLEAAQDHNKAVGRDTTTSTPSWTPPEDPAAMTRQHSFSFICILNCLDLSNNCLELSNLFYFLLSWTILNILLLCAVYFACFGGSPSGDTAKTGSSKKIKIIYLFVSWWIYGPTSQRWGQPRGPIYSSINRRIYGPTCQTRVRDPLPPPIYSLVMWHQST